MTNERGRPLRRPPDVRFVLGLIRQSLDDVGAESRILIASFPSFFVFGSSALGFRFFEAVKDINSDARRLRSPFKHSHVLTGSNGFTARILDARPS